MLKHRSFTYCHVTKLLYFPCFVLIELFVGDSLDLRFYWTTIYNIMQFHHSDKCVHEYFLFSQCKRPIVYTKLWSAFNITGFCFIRNSKFGICRVVFTNVTTESQKSRNLGLGSSSHEIIQFVIFKPLQILKIFSLLFRTNFQ